MNDRFKVSSLLARRLGEHQVPLPAVLRRAGLPAGFFQQEKIYVTTAELFGQLVLSRLSGVGRHLPW